MGRDNEGKSTKVFRNNYEGHMDKNKGVWNQGREVGMAVEFCLFHRFIHMLEIIFDSKGKKIDSFQ